MLGQCGSLAYLNLIVNSIGQEGAGRLARVLGMRVVSLAHLDLSVNSITAGGFEVLQSAETTVRMSLQFGRG